MAAVLGVELLLRSSVAEKLRQTIDLNFYADGYFVRIPGGLGAYDSDGDVLSMSR